MQEKPIIFFDGVCNLCSKSVQFILKHDKKDVFLFASLQGDTAKSKLAKFGSDGADGTSIVILNQGVVLTKSAAVLSIARQLGFPYNIAGLFTVLPSFISDKIYDFIAANRYKWFGKKESCWLPDPAYNFKFLP